MHGDNGHLTLEAQARQLERLIVWRQAQVEGAKTKLAKLYEAIERERGMGPGSIAEPEGKPACQAVGSHETIGESGET